MIACSAAFQMFGTENDDIIDGVEIGGAATFICRSRGSGFRFDIFTVAAFIGS